MQDHTENNMENEMKPLPSAPGGVVMACLSKKNNFGSQERKVQPSNKRSLQQKLEYTRGQNTQWR